MSANPDDEYAKLARAEEMVAHQRLRLAAYGDSDREAPLAHLADLEDEVALLRLSSWKAYGVEAGSGGDCDIDY